MSIIIQTNKTDRPPNKLRTPEHKVQDKLEAKIYAICELYADGMSLRKIAGIHKVSHESLRQVLINHKIYEKYRHKQKSIGDKKTDQQGYIHVFVGVGYPGATRAGWMLEHRLIMSQHLGRPLQYGDIVHHRDRNKSNNIISNLNLTTADEHPTCIRCPYHEFYVRTTGSDRMPVGGIDKENKL